MRRIEQSKPARSDLHAMQLARAIADEHARRPRLDHAGEPHLAQHDGIQRLIRRARHETPRKVSVFEGHLLKEVYRACRVASVQSVGRQVDQRCRVRASPHRLTGSRVGEGHNGDGGERKHGGHHHRDGGKRDSVPLDKPGELVEQRRGARRDRAAFEMPVNVERQSGNGRIPIIGVQRRRSSADRVKVLWDRPRSSR
ncbi:MAG: hypothetical protein AAGD00_03610 [Planctomycetota bacterium]